MANKRYLFKTYYLGKSKYYGSQRQPNLLTIEDCILNALKKRSYISTIEDSGFEVASRTDRFVSARGAYFSCVLEKEPILMEINSALPIEIGVWAYARVPIDFLSRFNAKFRHYLYLTRNSSSLNIDIMRKACKELEGKHDFINFSKGFHKNEKNTIRDMDFVNLSIKNDFLIFQFKSRAFLRQQIRRMVKKILELGTGRIVYEDFIELFDPSKSVSYQPADPRGLILWDIVYNSKLILKEDPKSRERMERVFLEKELTFSFKSQLLRLMQHYDFS